MSEKKTENKERQEPKLNLNMLPLERTKTYELKDGAKPNFRGFVDNNWLRCVVEDGEEPDEINNKILKAINERGGAVWLSLSGNLVYRPAPEADPVELSADDKAKRVFCSMLKINNLRLFKGYVKDEKFYAPDIAAKELLTVNDEFSPFAPSEFYLKDGLWKRTSFRPTEYMMLYKPRQCDVPENTKKLLMHLCNNREEYYEWVLNWLAGFFQTLQKSQVSLLWRGEQGSGKGIFFTDVLSELFGKRYCITVDQDRVESPYKNWVEEMLLLNLNEIAVDMKARRQFKNFLKQLVTDPSVQLEDKFEKAKSVRIYGNVLITSNEPLPIEIETSDRRFTVIKTGCKIVRLGWDPLAVKAAVKEELMDFAKALHTYKVDWRMYHTALDTPEKRAIQRSTNSKLSLYVQAVLDMNIDYFTELCDEEINLRALFESIAAGFASGKIYQTDLIKAYKELHDVDHSNKKIMENIRMIEPDVFGKEKTKKSGAFGKYFELPPVPGTTRGEI